MMSASSTCVDFLAEFDQQLERYTFTAVCGRQYVLFKKFAEGWLDGERMKALYVALWPDDSALPVRSAPRIKHRKIFAILMHIRRPRSMPLFQRAGIQLPATLDSLEACLGDSAEAKRIAQDFYQAQWRFCPHTFELDDDMNIQPNCILPINRRKSINEKGGTATLWDIEVFDDFVDELLQNAVKTSSYPRKNEKLGISIKCYRFALKTFRKEYRDTFDNEKKAFDCLHKHPLVIRCLGSIQCDNNHFPADPTRLPCQDSQSSTTYNLLLEFGKLDLDQYFKERSPPILAREIQKFWKDIFAIAYATEKIHNYTNQDNKSRHRGFHADIKPDNILLVGNAFKLADPGFLIFVEEKARNPKAFPKGGDYTYGAPEHMSALADEGVTQTIDTWSIGCVFSVAASWVVGDHNCVKQFSEHRRGAIKRGPRRDSFHDMEKVLPEVTEWHEFLKAATRKTDEVTPQVLDLVDKHMLLTDPEQRFSMKELCRELGNISQGFTASSDIPPAVEQSLLACEREAPERPSHQKSQQGVLPKVEAISRKQEKSARIGPLKKTAGRSESLSVSVQAQQATRPALGMDTARNIRSTTVHFQTHADRPSPIAVASPESPRPYEPRDIFQADKELSHTTKWTAFFTGRPINRKLEKHIKNRDIVFLVDNAESMERWWAKAEFVMSVLTRMCEGLDKNGMDLHFTLGSENLTNEPNPDKFREKMGSENVKPNKGDHTDMRRAMGEVFDSYRQRLQRGKRTMTATKHLTLIVLTDGRWQGMHEPECIKDIIVPFVKDVETYVKLDTRPVTIQFIQFGGHPSATLLLRDLDDNLHFERGIPDLIDVESCDGDVYKMFLGSLVEEYDKLEAPISPSQPPF